MALSIDTANISTAGTSAVAKTLTWSHTNAFATGSSILFVGAQLNASPYSPYVTGVTYNGVALTHVFEVTGGELWYLLDPAQGTHDVVVTGSRASQGIAAGAMTVNGRDPSTPLGTPVYADGASGDDPKSITANAAVASLVIGIIGVRTTGASGAITDDAGQDFRWHGGTTADKAATSHGSTKSGTGDVTLTWTTSNAWAAVAVPITDTAAGNPWYYYAQQ